MHLNLWLCVQANFDSARQYTLLLCLSGLSLFASTTISEQIEMVFFKEEKPKQRRRPPISVSLISFYEARSPSIPQYLLRIYEISRWLPLLKLSFVQVCALYSLVFCN